MVSPNRLRPRLPRLRRGPGSLYRKAASLHFLVTRDRREVVDFLRADVEASRIERLRLIQSYVHTTNHVRGYHTLGELLRVSGEVLSRERPVVVEAGCGKGSSTAKLSQAVDRVGGTLHVFDTFRGIPANDEEHQNLDGRRVVFREGAFRGSLTSVRKTVARHGCIEACTFHKGLFADTLPALEGSVDVALLDVDLIASTETCIRQLAPRMARGGVLFSQDGHLQATHALLGRDELWREIGVECPRIDGLGTDKLLVLRF